MCVCVWYECVWCVVCVCVLPSIFFARVVHRFKVDLTPFPTINRITAALKELKAFQVSAPSEQPDCPPELKN